MTARDPDGFLNPSWSRPTPVSFLMLASAPGRSLSPKPSLSLSERRELLATPGLIAGLGARSLSRGLARLPGPPGLTSGLGVKRCGEVTGGGR